MHSVILQSHTIILAYLDIVCWSCTQYSLTQCVDHALIFSVILQSHSIYTSIPWHSVHGWMRVVCHGVQAKGFTKWCPATATFTLCYSVSWRDALCWLSGRPRWRWRSLRSSRLSPSSCQIQKGMCISRCWLRREISCVYLFSYVFICLLTRFTNRVMYSGIGWAFLCR